MLWNEWGESLEKKLKGLFNVEGRDTNEKFKYLMV